MTQKNKCNACRKAKIKCDEVFPQCSSCIRQGKVCTRDRYKKKEFKFVEVRGETVNADDDRPSDQTDASEDDSNKQGIQSEQRRLAIITTRRHNAAKGRITRSKQPQVDLFLPRCETFRLLARWKASVMGNFRDSVDSYGSWSFAVPHFFGISEALEKTALCFLESRQAILDPTEANLRALRLSNFNAIRSVRQALETKGCTRVKGDILLAVQLLFMVEVLAMQSSVTFVIHVEGLVDLMIEHKKHLSDSDEQEKLISQIIFPLAASTGMVPALFSGTNHRFDDPEWLATSMSDRDIPGISHRTSQQAWKKLTHYFILIPRLARLVRLLTNSPAANTENEAIELAQSLFFSTVETDLISEAMASCELFLEPTIIHETIGAVPSSYRIASSRLALFLISYWSCRAFLCGLIDALIIAAPFTSVLFDIDAVHREDISVATNAVMAVQHTLRDATTDKILARGDEMRLVMLLEAAFGSWFRLEKRALAERLGSEVLERAQKMKRICLDISNRLLVASHANPITELGLELATSLFSGGPLFGSLQEQGADIIFAPDD